MMITKVHKIKLYPTKSQEQLFRQSCGVARFTYNWALEKWQKDYENGIKQSAYSLIKHLNSIKREEFPWMQETSKTCSQYAIHNLEKAYKKMWKEGSGYPKFKKKGVKDSFVAVENKETFKQKDFKIWIPRIGWVKCAENLRFEGKVNNVAVKRTADIWFAYVNIETISNETPTTSENQTTVGVDLGIKTMIVLSDGKTFENPKALRKNQKSLKRLQRGLSRKVKGSNNRKKHQMRLARKHYKISCIRSNALHEATSYITKNYDKIIIEDLNVEGMLKNKKLSGALSDVSFGELARQLAYKALWQGKELVKADRFFASSKLCSGCGYKKEALKLSERQYECENCGLQIDRDLNAAINLANYSPTPKIGECQAGGEGSSFLATEVSPSVKQEVDKLVTTLILQS